MVDIPSDWIWIVVLGFLLAFILCLGIGANDVANTFGTSVGSKVLTLKQACILASIFETSGAIFLGAKVSDTVRKGIIDVELYENTTEQFLLGNVAALTGSSTWLIIATYFKVPVSTTHSIVGATIGFSLVAKGAKGIDWIGLGKIVASWFISPILSGVIASGVFYFCQFFILSKKQPLEHGLRMLPVFYSITILVNLFSIFYEGPEKFKFDLIPLWGVFMISFGAGCVTALLVRVLLVPWQRRAIIGECSGLYEQEKLALLHGTPKEVTTFNTGSSKDKTVLPAVSDGIVLKQYHNEGYQLDEKEEEFKALQLQNNILQEKLPIDSIASNGARNTPPPSYEEIKSADPCKKPIEEKLEIKDSLEASRLFSFLQIMTAIFGSFTHGGNDVSNGIGPLVSIWLVATSGEVVTSAITPVWLLLYGGVAISLGLWVWGRGVIETLGENLTTVTPSSGFCIELSSAFTVLMASNIGIPVSSTHCQVGAVVFVGRVRAKTNVDWKLLWKIVFSWIVTVPAAMAFSAAIMALLELTL